MKMSIDKFLVIVMVMIALMIPTVAGCYGGICHAIRDSTASYQDGVITLELDGQIYEHFVEQMCVERISFIQKFRNTEDTGKRD